MDCPHFKSEELCSLRVKCLLQLFEIFLHAEFLPPSLPSSLPSFLLSFFVSSSFICQYELIDTYSLSNDPALRYVWRCSDRSRSGHRESFSWFLCSLDTLPQTEVLPDPSLVVLALVLGLVTSPGALILFVRE